ncbi:MAG TPA: hypothetical protein VFZ65_06680 [Planctomycetota bacterium]|nr:hypothetical protein [Planctomycetota bacterium]
MPRCPVLLALLLVPACGGSSGGGATPPAAAPARLTAADLDLGPATTSADLVVGLATTTEPAPVLLQFAVELPSALSVAPTDRLQAAVPLATLDGDFKDGRFVVLCGDGQNANASALQVGPLLRLRLVTATPRQPGTYTILLRDLRAATNDGGASAATTEPTSVQVTIR